MSGRLSKRRRTRSESSPEDPAKEIVGELRSEADLMIEEIKGYVGRNFSSAKHEVYFGPRMMRLQEVFKKMELEHSRVSRMAQSVYQVEKRLKSLMDVEWGKELIEAVAREAKEAGERAFLQVQKECAEALDKVKTEVAGAFDTMSVYEADRLEEVKVIGKTVKEGTMKANADLKVVKEKLEVSSGFMEEVRQNMDRVYGRLSEVHKVVAPLESSVVSRVDAVVTGERVAEAVERAVRSVNESVRRDANATFMDVDERVSDWSTVVKKGRARGPRVKLEVPRDERRVTRDEVVECLDAKAGDVRVRGLMRRGKDYVVEVHDASDVERLRRNERLREKGLTVDGQDGWRMPRVKVMGVDVRILKGELGECVRKRNECVFMGMTQDECKSEFVPEFVMRRGSRGERKEEWNDWVVRVSPRVFQRMCVTGRVYVGLRACRVVEFLEERKCAKCHRFGHVGAMCDACVTCAWCGVEGHHEVACERRRKNEEPRCANCIRYKFQQKNHSVNWRGCPVYQLQRAKLERNTCYE